MRFPRRPPLRDGDYLAHVRRRACCACGAPPPSEAAHLGPRGIGQKTDDRRTAPLCSACHRYWHDHGRLPELSREESENVQLRTQLELVLGWYSEEVF